MAALENLDPASSTSPTAAPPDDVFEAVLASAGVHSPEKDDGSSWSST
jgi:hypothetical protein